MICDGLTNITKIGFLSTIENVRQEAFKTSTIQSAFKNTGIWPFNPEVVLRKVEERRPRIRTPSPPPPSSSNNTPVTLRQINKVADKIKSSLQDGELTIIPEFAKTINCFVKGSLAAATEMVQTKRDFGRTKYAERVSKQRRTGKSCKVQSGGVLTAEQGREMVKKKGEDEVVKAQKILEAYYERAKRTAKKVFSEAAKEARKRRIDGRLGPGEIIDIAGRSRLLRRF